MVTIRAARWPADEAAISRLDTSFVTNRIYRLSSEEFSFRLVVESAEPPLEKRYPPIVTDEEERKQWDWAAVAEEDGALVGFVASHFSAWNRRLNVHHLYVQPTERGRGTGSRLIGEMDEQARVLGARCLWVETQNINYPAIQFYLRSGFRFCGLDDSLYDPAGLETDEVALFFSKHVG